MTNGQDSRISMPPQASDKDRRKGFFLRIYDIYDKASAWQERYDWLQWLISLFKTKAAISVAAVGFGGAATIGVIAVTKPELLQGWLPSAKPVAVTVGAERWGEAVVFPVEGGDAAGRRASFDVVALPKDYTWARKSDNQISFKGEILSEAAFSARVFTAELKAGLDRSADVIAVGAASQEGDVTEETERAARRAKTGVGWLTNYMKPSTRLWVLNLGQFQPSCAAEESGDTSWQRPVVMIGVKSQDEGVNLSEALTDAISGKTNLPSRDCYSSFDLRQYR